MKCEACKEGEVGHTSEQKQATEKVCESNQMSDLTGKYFKGAIIKMFTDIKETII